MRGLDSDEVYAFLTTVADEYEAVLSDNKKLRERMVELEDQVREYKNIESNLRNTLLTAEKVTAEAKENARREASLIVREAEVEAERATEAIRAHTNQLRREILELKKQKDNYLTRLKTLIDSHQNVLGGFEEDFAHVDQEIEKIGKKVEEDIKKPASPPRMSRETITEKYAHGPRDKVTWDDEPKREDEPRPPMPQPGWEAKETPGRDAAEPEDSAVSREAAETPEAEGAEMAQLKIEPIGGVDEVIKSPSSKHAMRGAESMEEAYDGGEYRKSDPGQGRRESDLRRNVAKSIEEKLYPEIITDKETKTDNRAQEHMKAPEEVAGDVGSDSNAAPGASFTGVETVYRSGASAPEDASTEQGYPAPEAQAEPAKPQDNWKKYEVRAEKPDWSEYEIAAGKQPQESDLSVPSEHEVEEALSNLTDAMRGSGDRAADHPAEDTAGKPKKPERKTDEGEGSDSKWSMDELRKNLTNIERDGEE